VTTNTSRSRIEIEPIGVVRSARGEVRDDEWGGTECTIVLDERFTTDALAGIEDFSHAEILFFFDRVDPAKIVAGARHPRNNHAWPAVGIFAQRGKNRPNRIGSTIVRVIGRDERVLRVAELDAVDGTPVLDIKPVMREFLPRGAVEQPSWSSELMERYWDRGG
jgi:tRNA (adenine37-N6)-methyltransferase